MLQKGGVRVVYLIVGTNMYIVCKAAEQLVVPRIGKPKLVLGIYLIAIGPVAEQLSLLRKRTPNKRKKKFPPLQRIRMPKIRQ